VQPSYAGLPEKQGVGSTVPMEDGGMKMRFRMGRASRLGRRIRKICDVLFWVAFWVVFAFTVWRIMGRGENPRRDGHFGVAVRSGQG